MLEVVEHDEPAGLGRVVLLGAERLHHRGHDLVRVGELGEVDEEDALDHLSEQLGGDLQREPRLAGAAGPGERDEAPLPEQLEEICLLADAIDERVGRDRQVRPVKALDRRELLGAELVDPLGAA